MITWSGTFKPCNSEHKSTLTVKPYKLLITLSPIIVIVAALGVSVQLKAAVSWTLVRRIKSLVWVFRTRGQFGSIRVMCTKHQSADDVDAAAADDDDNN